MQGANRLAGIQIQRLAAAGAVVVHHAYVLSAYRYGTPQPWFLRLYLGDLGVYVFFAISGYVIARQAEMAPGRFVLHRLLRIYPPYVVALAIGALLAGGSVALDPSLLLLPFGQLQSAAGVPYWSLIFEVMFYAVAALLMCGTAAGYDRGLMAWTAAIVVAAQIDPFPDVVDLGLKVVVSPLCLLFLAGAAYARAELGRRQPIIVLAVALAVLGFYEPGVRVRDCAAAALLSVALIHCVIRIGPLAGTRVGEILVRGGDWSYGIYLVHPMAISLAGAALAGLLPLWGLAVVALILGGAASAGFGAIEFAVYSRILRPWADRKRSLLPQISRRTN